MNLQKPILICVLSNDYIPSKVTLLLEIWQSKISLCQMREQPKKTSQYFLLYQPIYQALYKKPISIEILVSPKLSLVCELMIGPCAMYNN